MRMVWLLWPHGSVGKQLLRLYNVSIKENIRRWKYWKCVKLCCSPGTEFWLIQKILHSYPHSEFELLRPYAANAITTEGRVDLISITGSMLTFKIAGGLGIIQMLQVIEATPKNPDGKTQFNEKSEIFDFETRIQNLNPFFINLTIDGVGAPMYKFDGHKSFVHCVQWCPDNYQHLAVLQRMAF
ncbi:hypothetical protein C5167_036144 [Papaver somniferum]|nr:hypothetical protein C5167_036144 [Papaver somniferum]